MEKFKYHSPYETYEDCYFRVGHYGNFRHKGGIAIRIWNDTEGPIADVTVNLDIPLQENEIAIKDYSENTGMIVNMQSIGLIGDFPVRYERSGYVSIPIFVYDEKVLRKYSLE